jgi:hypothetical protein
MKIKIIKENKISDGIHAKAQYLQDKEGYEKDQAYAIAYQYEEDGKLEEMSSVGSGAIQGFAGPEPKRNKKIEEKFSTVGHYGGLKISIMSAEKEKAGHVERSKHQGLKNVMNEDDDDGTQPFQGDSERSAGVGWKLSDFADNSRNASRVFEVLKDVIENIGLEKMKGAILLDKSANSRVSVMASKFGYDSSLLEKIQEGDIDSIKKYYQFLINEFLFWIAYNPMASAQQYAGRHSLLSKPTKDLAYAQISRYIKNPSVNNPKSLGQRVSKQADEYFLDKDLDPALYDLPEE